METSCARCIQGNESAFRGIADYLRICYYLHHQFELQRSVKKALLDCDPRVVVLSGFRVGPSERRKKCMGR